MDAAPIDPARALPSMAEGEEKISVRGARVHNLRSVSVDVPRGKLVVVTGPSGSGKSSLAFDTIYAEGQRRYIESLSTFARQFFDQLERPDVDEIDGLQPTLAIDQQSANPHPRSTVGTITEIHDFLRLMTARLGRPHCLKCGQPIVRQAPEQMAAEILHLPAQARLMLLAPLWTTGQGNPADAFDKIRRAGFVRVRVNGQLYDLEQLPKVDRQGLVSIDAVVDRLVVREGVELRLNESIRSALKHSDGALVVLWQPAEDRAAAWRELRFTTNFACAPCGYQLEPVEPRSFSFNSPYGACPRCEGLGKVVEFDPELTIPEPERSLEEGAVLPWRGTAVAARARMKSLLAWAKIKSIPTSVPWKDLSAEAREDLLRGDALPLDGAPTDPSAKTASLSTDDAAEAGTAASAVGGTARFPGILGLLEEDYQAAKTDAAKEKLEPLRGEVVCPECRGARLRAQSRSVRLGGKGIHEISALTTEECRAFFQELRFEGPSAAVAAPLVAEILGRLDFLLEVGLDYLTLDRAANTLSGGESQRIRLARGIGSGLLGVCYVLDEPSIGLHARDNDRLNAALRSLQQQGNSVIVVEHDEAVMRTADHLIDVGPGAGVHGGTIVAAGTVAEVMAHPDSLTGAYLSGRKTFPRRAERRAPQEGRALRLEGATSNNLQSVNLEIPLGLLVGVTGVSGSGKSTLLHATLARALTRHFHHAGPRPGVFSKLSGVEKIDRFIEVDQAPLGRSPRSNPATYTGIFDEIRKVFAATKEAKARGYKAARFSFNAQGGRCEVCQGQGLRKIEMHFLPDFWTPCASCGGKRFNRATLEIRFKDLSIADALDLRIDQARTFFDSFSSLVRILDLLLEVGLGYLTLGQPANTLSGGEAQRIKLATELSRSAGEHTLYLLDEPTTGLHFEDVKNLLLLLQRLVDQGHTVLVVEHHLDVIRACDWLIDLGPGGGKHGGRIVASGPPEEIARCAESVTGRYLDL